MKKSILLFVLCFLILTIAKAQAQDSRAISFDQNWRFKKDTLKGAEIPSYDDSHWRILNLPHDWSIEDLPNQKEGEVQGPFTKESVGKASTGFTEGGIGWYRKTFKLDEAYAGKQIQILFDGVYMDSDVWINGHHLGNHPYGYTSFWYNLTNYLNPAGKANVIVVRAKNLGKNSRWYAGSGIYRHVWLLPLGVAHSKIWGISVTTPSVSKNKATVSIESSVENVSSVKKTIVAKVELIDFSGKIVVSQNQSLIVPGSGSAELKQVLAVASPKLWSLNTPALYKAKVTLLAGTKVIDQTITPFGIRSLKFDGQKGFLLNGDVIKLKGGCVHHDLGPLGAASIDRAEDRKVQLLKLAGYNAIRLSHNPPAPEFLNACDRRGMLVLDEAFDMWEAAKSPQDYHLYFKDWSQRDLESIIKRDRNHPSVIMWSIGNEIYEAPDSSGYQNAKRLAAEVRELDPTRAVTEAMVFLPPYTKKPWTDYQPHLLNLDVDGYNYFLDQSVYFQRDSATNHRFEAERALHTGKLYMATEYLNGSALENWAEVEKYPWFIGGFSWTAMDYIGEAGIGYSRIGPEAQKLPGGLMGMGFFYRNNWPVFNADCGDLDLIGNRKAASYYKNVVWRNSPIELLVGRPVPDGQKEAVAPWGFKDELKCWTWPGQEGKMMQVDVYSRCKTVKLELNGKIIAEQAIPEGSITATFQLAYHPGQLIARGFDNGKETGSSTLVTAGKPVAIKLVADKKTIADDQNDLSYVSVEVIDSNGNVVPSVDGLDVKFQIEGNANIAGVGNGSPSDMSSFQQNHKMVYQGKALAIIRPKGGSKGVAVLKASAAGLKDGLVNIKID